MIKWIGIGVAALLGLALAAAVFVSLTFDPNDYKDRAAQWVEQRTGRELTIEGDLKLSFFPWLGVATGRLSLSDAPGFQATPFATVESASVRVKLLPLLGQRFEVDTVELSGLILNLARDTDGRGNWQDLLDSESAPGAVQQPGNAAGSPLDSVEVAGLRLSDATIYWREPMDEVRYVIREMSLTTGQLRAGEPIDLNLGLNLLSVEPQFNLQLDMAGTTTIDQALDTLAVSDVNIDFDLKDGRDTSRARGSVAADVAGSLVQRTLTMSGGRLTAELAELPGSGENLGVTSSWKQAELSLADETASVDSLTTVVNGMTANWAFQVQQLLSEPSVTGSLTATGISWEQALGLAAIDLPEGIDPAALTSFDLTSDISYQAPAGLALTSTRLNTLGLAATGALSIGDSGALTGRVDIPSFSAEQLIRVLANALPESVNTSAIQRLALAADFRAQPGGREITVPDFALEALGATLSGSVQVSGAAGERQYAGTLKAPRFDAGPMARAFAGLLPENLDAGELGPLAIDTRFRYLADADEMHLPDLALEALGLQASGALTARSFSAAPTWTGRLTTRNFSPRELMTRFGQQVPQAADARALTRATVSSDLTVNSGGGEFKSLRLNLDDSLIRGSFRVENYDNPSYGFELAIDTIDVDRYLPPRAADAGKDTDTVTTDQVEVPADTLDKLNLDGRVTVGRMTLAGLDFADVATGIKSGNGSARLESARARLYGGAFAGSLQVDTAAKPPAMRLRGDATTIQLEPLLVALRGESNLSGSGSFQLDLAGRGRTVLENVQSAAGNVEFALRDGALKGFNLGHALCRAYNAGKKLPAPTAKVPQSTTFTLMRGAATVQEGIATSPNLEATSSFLSVNGSGSTDLANQGLNYDLVAKLSGSIAIEGCQTMDGVIGQSIPFTVRGTITDPKIAPDFGKLLEQTLRRRVEEELKDRLLERLGLQRPGETGNEPAPAPE